MLRLPCALGLALGVVALAPACSQPDPGPTEYIKFKYVVTPPGTTTGDNPLVLPVSPAPTANGMTCFRQQNQIYLYGSAGSASVEIILSGTATTPYQQALQASTQTAGVAEVNLQIPLTVDMSGNYTNPFGFKTSAAGNSLTCVLTIGGPDPFAALDGDFTCQTLSTDPGRHLNLTEGHFHAVPCATAQ